MDQEQQVARQHEEPVREEAAPETAVIDGSNAATVAEMPPPPPVDDPTPLLSTFALEDGVEMGDPDARGGIPGQVAGWQVDVRTTDAKEGISGALIDGAFGRDGSAENPSLGVNALAWATRAQGASYEAGDDGTAVLRANDDWSVSASGGAGVIGVNGGVLQDQDATLSMGPDADGETRSEAEMRRHLTAFEGELASGPGAPGEGQTSVDGFMQTIEAMGEGDSYDRTAVTDWSAGADGTYGVVKGGFSVGEREATSERYTVDENGRVTVQVEHTDADRRDAFLGAGKGAVGVSGGSEDTEGVALELAFDVQSEDPAVADAARRDLALYRFSGLLPGTAAELGIDSYEDAVAWLDDQEAQMEASGRTAEELNEAALEAARTDPDYAADHGYGRIEDTRGASQDASASLLGVELWRRHWEQERGTVIVDGQEVDTGESSVERWSLFGGGGREGSKVAADESGDFQGLYWATDQENVGEQAEGPLAEALREHTDGSDAVAAAVDDPTLVRAVEGDLAALGEVYAEQTRDPEEEGGSVASWMRMNPPMEEVEELLAAGGDPDTLFAGYQEQVDAIGRYEAGEMSLAELEAQYPGATERYADAAVAYGINGGEGENGTRFEAIAALASVNPERAGDMLADVVATGDVDAIRDLQTWLSDNGLDGMLSVESGLVAGSSHLEALGTALDDGNRGLAAREAGELVTKLEAAGMDEAALQETLAGFDVSGAGEDAGGLRRFYDAMSPGDRGRFMELVGGTEAGQAFLQGLARERPDLMLDGDGQLLPAFTDQVAPGMDEGEGFDAEAYQQDAVTAREAALREGDGSSLPVGLASAWEYYARIDPSMKSDFDRMRAVMGDDVSMEDMVRGRFDEDDPAFQMFLEQSRSAVDAYSGEVDDSFARDWELYQMLEARQNQS